MPLGAEDSRAEQEPPSVREAVHRVAELLPAQGPISVFIHHNPLHSFEHLPFEEAVVAAGRLLGCEPYLSEEAYRAEFETGRIIDVDLREAVSQEFGEIGRRLVAGLVPEEQLAFASARHGIPLLRGQELRWRLAELDVLERFRPDIPADARDAVASARGITNDSDAEADYVGALWNGCLKAVQKAAPRRPVLPSKTPIRHRDLIQAVTGIDTDEWIHPPLIRFLGTYLDQGYAIWPMGSKADGLRRCFFRHFRNPMVGLVGPWAGALRNVLDDEVSRERTAAESIAVSLRDLGVDPGEYERFLLETVLPIRGWAGMVRQIEVRPDRVPVAPVPARLDDLLAVLLLLERAAISQAVRESGAPPLELHQVRDHFRALAPAPQPPAVEERAWILFQAAQLVGLDPVQFEAMAPADVQDLEDFLEGFDGIARRRVLHAAYERHLQRRILSAISHHKPRPAPNAPSFQAIFCIDEREESFRRHLEEADPRAETFSAAGFFGVAMYFKSHRDAHPRPLCPAVMRPANYVEERSAGAGGDGGWRGYWARLSRQAGMGIFVGSRTMTRGALLMSVLGALMLIPLVFRVLFPRHHHRIRRRRSADLALSPLEAEGDAQESPVPGARRGFTLAERVAIVGSVLSSAGLGDRLSPVVVVVGHGSSSLNNPHESAHDCGACGGGQGGPNARVFAMMANDPRVRKALREQGISIPGSTWFVAAQRNTASNEVAFYDLGGTPESLRVPLAEVRRAFEKARRREALERCRRFVDAPRDSRKEALWHVEERSFDLAQPRPEYGHATSAFCVVGRRSRTRRLFLDRRAFLVSYDPGKDADGSVLTGVLAAVVPVVAGIALEYYFSRVDNAGYGCGTKLPHNVASLLGVMEGALSDLRTGLPWQMVEIHEPVRLTLVVETTPERLGSIITANAQLRRLVENRWIFFYSLDPEGPALAEHTDRRWQPYVTGRAPLVVPAPSIDWAKGKRGHLPFVEIADATV